MPAACSSRGDSQVTPEDKREQLLQLLNISQGQVKRCRKATARAGDGSSKSDKIFQQKLKYFQLEIKFQCGSLK